MGTLNYTWTKAEEAWTLALDGELDLRLAPELRRVFEDVVRRRPPEVIVDLERVPFIDSSILATFVFALKTLRQEGSDLRIVQVQPAVRDAIEITRLTDSFRIV